MTTNSNTAVGELCHVRRGGQDGVHMDITPMAPLILGRDSVCDIQVFQLKVRRRHLSVFVDENRQVWVDPITESNEKTEFVAAKLNGVSIEEKTSLKDGDMLTLCNRSFRIQLFDDEAKESNTEDKPSARKLAAPGRVLSDVQPLVSDSSRAKTPSRRKRNGMPTPVKNEIISKPGRVKLPERKKMSTPIRKAISKKVSDRNAALEASKKLKFDDEADLSFELNQTVEPEEDQFEPIVEETQVKRRRLPTPIKKAISSAAVGRCESKSAAVLASLGPMVKKTIIKRELKAAKLSLPSPLRRQIHAHAEEEDDQYTLADAMLDENQEEDFYMPLVDAVSEEQVAASAARPPTPLKQAATRVFNGLANIVSKLPPMILEDEEDDEGIPAAEKLDEDDMYSHEFGRDVAAPLYYHLLRTFKRDDERTILSPIKEEGESFFNREESDEDESMNDVSNINEVEENEPIMDEEVALNCLIKLVNTNGEKLSENECSAVDEICAGLDSIPLYSDEVIKSPIASKKSSTYRKALNTPIREAIRKQRTIADPNHLFQMESDNGSVMNISQFSFTNDRPAVSPVKSPVKKENKTIVNFSVLDGVLELSALRKEAESRMETDIDFDKALDQTYLEDSILECLENVMNDFTGEEAESVMNDFTGEEAESVMISSDESSSDEDNEKIGNAGADVLYGLASMHCEENDVKGYAPNAAEQSGMILSTLNTFSEQEQNEKNTEVVDQLVSLLQIPVEDMTETQQESRSILLQGLNETAIKMEGEEESSSEDDEPINASVELNSSLANVVEKEGTFHLSGAPSVLEALVEMSSLTTVYEKEREEEMQDAIYYGIRQMLRQPVQMQEIEATNADEHEISCAPMSCALVMEGLETFYTEAKENNSSKDSKEQMDMTVPIYNALVEIEADDDEAEEYMSDSDDSMSEPPPLPPLPSSPEMAEKQELVTDLIRFLKTPTKNMSSNQKKARNSVLDGLMLTPIRPRFRVALPTPLRMDIKQRGQKEDDDFMSMPPPKNRLSTPLKKAISSQSSNHSMIVWRPSRKLPTPLKKSIARVTPKASVEYSALPTALKSDINSAPSVSNIYDHSNSLPTPIKKGIISTAPVSHMYDHSKSLPTPIKKGIISSALSWIKNQIANPLPEEEWIDQANAEIGVVEPSEFPPLPPLPESPIAKEDEDEKGPARMASPLRRAIESVMPRKNVPLTRTLPPTLRKGIEARRNFLMKRMNSNTKQNEEVNAVVDCDSATRSVSLSALDGIAELIQNKTLTEQEQKNIKEAISEGISNMVKPAKAEELNETEEEQVQSKKGKRKSIIWAHKLDYVREIAARTEKTEEEKADEEEEEEEEHVLEFDIMKLRVVDLREHLHKLGLPTNGKKAQLQARLQEAMLEAQNASPDDEEQDGETSQEGEEEEEDNNSEEEEEEEGINDDDMVQEVNVKIEVPDFNAMRVAELREKCKLLDLPIAGRKAQLIERLEEHFYMQVSAKEDVKVQIVDEPASESVVDNEEDAVETEEPAQEMNDSSDEEPEVLDINKMKVVELKAELVKLGLSTAGRRANLQVRLRKALEEETEDKMDVSDHTHVEETKEESESEESESEEINVDNMKVAELKAELSKRGAETSGKKAILQARLRDLIAGISEEPKKTKKSVKRKEPTKSDTESTTRRRTRRN